MERIPDELLTWCFYLYTSAEDAETGSRIGGTAFAVAVEFDPPNQDYMQMYAVTAKHVVDRGATVGRINKHGGGFDTFEFDPWYSPAPDSDGCQDDIAVAPLRITNNLFIQAVPIGMGLWPTRMKEEDYGIGDPVFMLGRLWGHEGKVLNTPAVRTGNISMMPIEPVYNEELGRDSWMLLVEMRSISGFSGSPVVVYKDKPFGPSARILGVDCGHLTSKSGHIENAGIALVTPFWKVINLLLDDPRVVAARAELAKTIKRDPPAMVADSELGAEG